MAPEDFLRKLIRDGFPSASEMDERLLQLSRLKAGELRPTLLTNAAITSVSKP